MIRVDIASRSFGETRVLGPVSFTIAQGEIVAVLGRSGVGKTTLLRIVSGVDNDFEGRVEGVGRQACVFQEPTLLPWRSTLENLTLIHPGLGRDEASEMLARVGLDGKAGLFPGQLSLGQQRRLALARAFAGRPEFLIMDEPFVSLDPETALRMLGLTEKLIADTGPSGLFVTHDRREAERLADRILVLKGSPATLGADAS